MGEYFDIKRFAVHDGPGIRATAFLKGCPLDCVWCHNPEGKRRGPEICHLSSLCIGCKACVSACEQRAAIPQRHGVTIDRKNCICCGSCAAACPAGALTVKGVRISAEKLMDELARDEVFFRTSGGGITLSGGDPLFQSKFTAEVLQIAKSKGYHTAVETCLYASSEAISELCGLVDLWLTDLKIRNDSEHKRLTGRSNRQILKNYEYLARHNHPMLTRIPVIPGCTDSNENLVDLGRYIAKTNPTAHVELMFYNPLAASKYQSYDITYLLSGSNAYTLVRQNELKTLMASTGVAKII